eukprot:m.1412845 g.1412845  ORF g.1412845 m.1412845 type:complete len:114 (+) comp25028_c0_seq105:1216-1557(+)
MPHVCGVAEAVWCACLQGGAAQPLPPMLSVACSNGRTLQCTAVVMAVAPSIAHETIAFEPALPAARVDVVALTRRGHYSKFILRFPRAWWREKGCSGNVNWLQNHMWFFTVYI